MNELDDRSWFRDRVRSVIAGLVGKGMEWRVYRIEETKKAKNCAIGLHDESENEKYFTFYLYNKKRRGEFVNTVVCYQCYKERIRRLLDVLTLTTELEPSPEWRPIYLFPEDNV